MCAFDLSPSTLAVLYLPVPRVTAAGVSVCLCICQEGGEEQAKPAGCKHSAIQAVTQPRTQRSPTAFTHLPTCILALCDIPHMHSCVILADCARDSVQHGAQLHIDSHICRNTFAKQRDPRITRIIHLPACMCVGKGSKTPKNTKKQRGLRKRT